MHKLLLVLAIPTTCLLLAGCATTGGYGSLHTPAAIMAAEQQPLPTAADDQSMYLQLIQKMQQRGLYYASLAHIAEYAKRYGSNPELGILRADALRETRQSSAAAAAYQALVNSPQAAAAWHGLGLIAAADGHYTQAIGNFEKATQLAPINATYLSDLGYARLYAGDLAGAGEPLAKAAELQPGDTKAIANLALLLMVEGRDSRAESMMQQAKLPQTTRQAVLQLAIQLRQQYALTDRAAPTSAPSATTPTTARATTSAAFTVPRLYGISANVLSRFQKMPTGGSDHEQP